ncbi:VanW family protein [Aeromicrobium sp. Leaf350]|uniref:VanW family protein n=1 Tax=Aeromicrobium sp. Leaf350 TaxID=2876565 RepID=UPI001E47BFE8|nr:VanW family protein [Aeromicrobium sp. Leaf350]
MSSDERTGDPSQSPEPTDGVATPDEVDHELTERVEGPDADDQDPGVLAAALAGTSSTEPPADDAPVEEPAVEEPPAEKPLVDPEATVLTTAAEHDPHSDLPPVDRPQDADGTAVVPPVLPPVDEPEADGEEPKKRRRWPWFVAAAVIVLGGLYVGGYYFTGSRLAADTTIAGVDVGGMSPAKAEATLTDELGPREGQNLTFVLDESEFTFTATDMGLALDAKGSVEEAGGKRSWNPLDMVETLFGGEDHPAELTVDTELFDTARATIAQTIDIPVTESLITFPEGQPVATQPADGRQVTSDDLLESLREVYLLSDDPVEIPTQVVEPGVDAEGLEVAMQEIAVPAVSAPVLLNVGQQQIELPVTAYTPALQIRTEGDEMKPFIDPVALAGPLTDSTTGIGEKAVDATIDIVNGAPVITPGKPGIGLQPDVMATELLPVLTAAGPERALTLEAQPVEPEFTTADAEALKIVEKVSEFETNYPNTQYRNINQGRAAELIDGTILEPGEQFSFDKVVGQRTAANGFVQGGVIEGGRFVESFGGGVSQVATTTYNAAFFAGLDDDEHKPHSLYLTRYPLGREATVNWGTTDLKFTNSTPYGILIKAWVVPSNSSRQGTMHVEMWSTKYWDIEAGVSAKRNFRSGTTVYDTSPECTPQAAIQGFDVDVTRTFKQNGQVVKTEVDTAVYRAGDAVVCGPPPA